MAAGREDYERRVAEVAVRVRRSAFGSAPSSTDGSATIAWRDAGDRADRLEQREEAAAAMRRALEGGDKTMVKAIVRRAHSKGWAEVAALGVDVELLQQLSRVEELSSPKGRRRD